MTAGRTLVLGVGAFVSSIGANAGPTLAAADAPIDPPWAQPATLSYVRNGDGTTSATVDAVLRYKWSGQSASAQSAVKTSYGAGVYLHRDTTSSAPKNDRGVSANYGQLIVNDGDNSQGVRSLNWNGKISFGKALEAFKDASGAASSSDRTKDRELLQLSGYFQPALAGVPVPPESNLRPPMVMFFDSSLGLYSDNSKGGSGKGVGRLSGGLLGLSANFAPFGIDPAAGFNRVGGLGFVPTIRFAAQVQHDLASSGERPKDTYKLYTAEVALAFSKLSGGGVVPTLNLSRTIGADLLTGRAKSSKTELSLGLSF